MSQEPSVYRRIPYVAVWLSLTPAQASARGCRTDLTAFSVSKLNNRLRKFMNKMTGHFGCLVLCLYGMREHFDINQSENRIWEYQRVPIYLNFIIIVRWSS